MDITKGAKTSEFWLTVAGIVTNVLISKGVIDSGSADSFSKALLLAFQGLGTMIMIAVYTMGRSDLKKSIIENSVEEEVDNPSGL